MIIQFIIKFQIIGSKTGNAAGNLIFGFLY
jgi:hypothetical protein